MDNRKWIVTAVSVCIVGSLLLGGVAGATPSVTIQQGDEYTFYDDFADNYNTDWSNDNSHTESNGQLIIEPSTVTLSQEFTNAGPGTGSFTIEGKIDRVSNLSYAGIRSSELARNFVQFQYDAIDNELTLRTSNADYERSVNFSDTASTEYRISYDSATGEYQAETLGESWSVPVGDDSWTGSPSFQNGGDSSDMKVDWVGYKEKGKGLIAGNVTDSNGQPIQNATVTLTNTTTGNTNTTQTDSFGEFEFRKEFGQYNVSAAKEDYVGVEKQVPYDSQNQSFGRVTLTLQRESERLRFDAPSFLKHGAEGEYSAAANVGDDWQNVTDEITVTSNNANIVTINSERKVIIATSNVSRNGNTTLNVEWTDPETGETLELSHKVTVANLTVDNLDILPPTQKFPAVIGGGTDQNPADRSYLAIFLATALASAVSLIATVTAGLAIMPVVLFAAMIVGLVEIQVVIAATLVCIFLGLNIGQNIDYGVR